MVVFQSEVTCYTFEESLSRLFDEDRGDVVDFDDLFAALSMKLRN